GLSKTGTWQVGLSTGTAFQPEVWLSSKTWAAPAKIQAIVPGDFNGDGKTDLAAHLANGEWAVAISNGSVFVPAIWGTYRFPRGSKILFHTGDFNDDGMSDVIGLNRHGDVWEFISIGSSFTDPVQTKISVA